MFPQASEELKQTIIVFIFLCEILLICRTIQNVNVHATMHIQMHSRGGGNCRLLLFAF